MGPGRAKGGEERGPSQVTLNRGPPPVNPNRDPRGRGMVGTTGQGGADPGERDHPRAEVLELRSKMEHLERMYKSMGTELMRAWGREEFGDTGEKQKYRYKYTKATVA